MLHESLTRNMFLPYCMVRLCDLHCGRRGPKTISQGLHNNICEWCPAENALNTNDENPDSESWSGSDSFPIRCSKYLLVALVAQQVMCFTLSGLFAKNKGWSGSLDSTGLEADFGVMATVRAAGHVTPTGSSFLLYNNFKRNTFFWVPWTLQNDSDVLSQFNPLVPTKN